MEPVSTTSALGPDPRGILEPPGLPAVDRSYVLVQSEVYAQPLPRRRSPEVSAEDASVDRPAYVTFNGVAGQNDHRPLAAWAGQ